MHILCTLFLTHKCMHSTIQKQQVIITNKYLPTEKEEIHSMSLNSCTFKFT